MRPRFGDTPLERARDRGVTEADIASPLQKDSQGRVGLNLGGPMAETPDGKLDVRVGNGLSVKTGSPARIEANTSRTIVVDAEDRLQARLTAQDIIGLERYVRRLILTSSVDISYAEPLVADTGSEPPFLYNEDGDDIVMSEVLH